MLIHNCLFVPQISGERKGAGPMCLRGDLEPTGSHMLLINALMDKAEERSRSHFIPITIHYLMRDEHSGLKRKRRKARLMNRNVGEKKSYH